MSDDEEVKKAPVELTPCDVMASRPHEEYGPHIAGHSLRGATVDQSTVMDSFALTMLTYRYARVIDDRNFPGLHELFTDDATVDYGHPAATSVPIGDHIRAQAGRTDLPVTHHMFFNHEFDIHGDTARGRFRMMAQHIRDDVPGGAFLLLGGGYEHSYRRSIDGWRITSLQFRAKWGWGNPAVLNGWFAEVTQILPCTRREHV
jgi:hypothetical protein